MSVSPYSSNNLLAASSAVNNLTASNRLNLTQSHLTPILSNTGVPVPSQSFLNPLGLDEWSPEQLSGRFRPEWGVLHQLSDSFGELAIEGRISKKTLGKIRNQYYANGNYPEAIVTHQLIRAAKTLMGISAPWQRSIFHPTSGYTQADLQLMLAKIQAGKTLDSLISGHFDRYRKETTYAASLAQIVDVSLTIALLAFGTRLAFFRK